MPVASSATAMMMSRSSAVARLPQVSNDTPRISRPNSPQIRVPARRSGCAAAASIARMKLSLSERPMPPGSISARSGADAGRAARSNRRIAPGSMYVSRIALNGVALGLLSPIGTSKQPVRGDRTL